MYITGQNLKLFSIRMSNSPEVEDVAADVDMLALEVGVTVVTTVVLPAVVTVKIPTISLYKGYVM